MPPTDPANAYAAVLARSVSTVQILGSATRVTSEDAQEVAEATSVTSSIAFAVPNAGATKGIIVETLSECLTTFSFNHDQVKSALAIGGLSVARRNRAAELLADWKFTGNLIMEHIPDNAPSSTLCIIRAEDFAVDMLLQPLRLLQRYISRCLATWKPLVEKGIEAFPVILTWDPSLAVIENQIIQALGIKPTDPKKPLKNMRFNSSTVAGAVTFPTDTRMAFASRTSLNIDDEVAGGRLKRLMFSSLSALDNLEPFRNEMITPVPTELVRAGTDAVIDPFYGQVYEEGIFSAQPGVYGHGSLLTPLFDPSFSNAGYLRVPFRAVSRHFARDRADLQRSITFTLKTIERFGGPHVVFRGQTKEYTLGRSPELLEHLYGHSGALEPSLLASGERRKLKSESWQAIWGSLIEYHAIVSGLYPKASDEISALGEPEGDLMKLALAQHYGLPTPTLDVTLSWKVAVWFALNKLVPGASGRVTVQPQGDDEISVLYVFVTDPRRAFSGKIDDYPAARPSRQEGLLLPTAWGLSRNRTANYLVSAIYFQGRIAREFDDLPTAQYLFPDEAEDKLMRSAAEFYDASPGNVSVGEIYQNLYKIE